LNLNFIAVPLLFRMNINEYTYACCGALWDDDFEQILLDQLETTPFDQYSDDINWQIRNSLMDVYNVR